jgi:hypothetical protein
MCQNSGLVATKQRKVLHGKGLGGVGPEGPASRAAAQETEDIRRCQDKLRYCTRFQHYDEDIDYIHAME